MTLKLTHPVPVAAAKAGISQATGYRIGSDPVLPTQRKLLRSRRRADPLADIFAAEVIPLLKSSPGLRPVAIFEELLRRHPDLSPGIRRTLERRIRAWRAEHGPEQEVIFRQTHTPGKMGLSDFTDMGRLSVTIAAQPLEHRLYHFRLACSGFEHAHVVLGGESHVALAEGLQNALWSLGGVPKEHRTDSRSAAFKNLARAAQDDLTDRVDALCRHYGMTPSRNTKGVSPEERAFYDALAQNRSAVEVMSNQELQVIAAELVQTVRSSAGADWWKRDNVRARMRVAVRRILKRHGYPPDLTAEAVKTVLRQAEAIAAEIN